MKLVITGAAGQLGRATAALVLERVDPAELILVTRNPAALADLGDQGAVVRHGDFDEPGSLAAAFAGGERMLLISTDAVGRRVAQHQYAIAAAREAGVTHIAYTSITNPVAQNPAGVVPDHAGTEQALAESGLEWTYLRNALYSEYRVLEAQGAAESGQLFHNQGDGVTAYVSREDCAAAAAAVLVGGPEHAGRAYDITGPELLGADDLAALYSSFGDSAVAAIDVGDGALIEGMVKVGLPAEVAELIASFGAAIRGGYLSRLSGDVALLTGRDPVSLRSVLDAALASS
jgi:NAD(P)H dehydrogenase (quinone)